MTNFSFFLSLKKNKNKKKGKDEKYGSELTTPENSSSPGMMDMHGGWWDAVVVGGGGGSCLSPRLNLEQASVSPQTTTATRAPSLTHPR